MGARRSARAFEADGFELVDDHADADFVLNMFDTDDPKAFRRSSRGTYSASFYELDEVPEDVLRTSYPNLVRTLANVVVLHVPGEGVWFTTMERGTYKISDDPAEVFERLAPLAKSKLVIDNEFVTDLEPELWDGDEVTADISAAGKRMGELDLLPAPFPVHEFLNERDLRHVMRLYQVGGLSYGNLSARKDATRFWMSASGVDKTALEEPGRDILLVTGYDEPNASMRISVPPGVEPRRVSVDAIEHWMIYQAHPDVGAILHVHAWMEGIAATDINYPCGTQELAESVAELIDREPDPAHAVIGLRNHGITATGDSLTEILDRIQVGHPPPGADDLREGAGELQPLTSGFAGRRPAAATAPAPRRAASARASFDHAPDADRVDHEQLQDHEVGGEGERRERERHRQRPRELRVPDREDERRRSTPRGRRPRSGCRRAPRTSSPAPSRSRRRVVQISASGL